MAREPAGGWLAFLSTTARGKLWLAGSSDQGPWWLASDHTGVIEEFGNPSTLDHPGLAAYVYPDKRALYQALDRVYQLGVSLPSAPLAEFEAEVSGLSRTTEAERTVVQRIGQDVFRRALLHYWDGRCAVTGIGDAALLRASHIVPWAECVTDAQRLDVNNGLLLSALWDSAFDAKLVSFDESGQAVLSGALTATARLALGEECQLRQSPTPSQRRWLQEHRRQLVA